MILIVCALARELKFLAPRSDIEIAACGIGPVESALFAARALARRPYAAVINAGIGGAFRGRAVVGEAVAIAEDALADFGLEGGAPLFIAGEGLPVDRAASDAGLLADCEAAGIRAARGITVHQVTTTATTAARLLELYDADVEAMEGFSVLRAASLAGIPAVEIRGISNYVDDRRTSEWDFEGGARAAAGALGALLDRLGHSLR